MSRQQSAVPAYTRHKGRNLARVRFHGCDYLGRYNSKESKRAYAHFLRWIQVTDHLPKDWQTTEPNGSRIGKEGSQRADGLTVVELLARYLKFARGYYRASNEHDHIKYAIKPLRDLFAELPAVKFGPVLLERVRDQMIASGLTRPGVNKRITRIRRMFRWAVARELIPPSVSQALDALPPRKAGRTEAGETKPVAGIADGDIAAVLPHVSPQICAMIQLQRFSGMRPGEVCNLRACDIDTSGDVWIYRPAKHKNTHRGQSREIYLGSRAQCVLRDWLQDKNGYLFSPAEATEWHHKQRAVHRRTPASQGNRPGTNRVAKPTKKTSDKYNTRSYRQAIVRACKRAGIAPWSPNQIRHTVGTEIRREYGVEAAQVVLGQKRLESTQIYAETNRQRGMQLIKKLG